MKVIRTFFLVGLSALFAGVASAQFLAIDHLDTDINALQLEDIQLAKETLHIVYGHSSHGSQLITGMTGLVDFADNGGAGLSLPSGAFSWNHDGSDGALHLHDMGVAGDVGYFPQWVNETTAYLDNPENAATNVVVWSWCGQHLTKYRQETLEGEYLEPMSQLEVAYPDVVFVYMTGHVYSGLNHDDTVAANNVIRAFCEANGKVLFDFADIERYDPDGNFFEIVSDNCDYYESPEGGVLGNWAEEWQNLHTEGVDWYYCYAAHSRPLNANRKAYAAWSLWTLVAKRISGTSYVPGLAPVGFSLMPAYPNPFNPNTRIAFNLKEAGHIHLAIHDVAGSRIRVLLDGQFPQGDHNVNWDGKSQDGSDVSSGTYLVRMVSGGEEGYQKICLVR